MNVPCAGYSTVRSHCGSPKTSCNLSLVNHVLNHGPAQHTNAITVPYVGYSTVQLHHNVAAPRQACLCLPNTAAALCSQETQPTAVIVPSLTDTVHGEQAAVVYPYSEPDLISALRRSPALRWVKPYWSTILAHWVPFPLPGPPERHTRSQK